MFSILRTLVAATALTFSLTPLPALAQGDAISVMVNMARILRINSPAATVVVGNPGVADVTIQDPQTLILTGRSFGATNLIIMDQQGNPIIDTFVEVIQGNDELVTVYQGASRTTLSCEPVCQPVIMLGDDTNYTTNNITSQALITNSAN